MESPGFEHVNTRLVNVGSPLLSHLSTQTRASFSGVQIRDYHVDMTEAECKLHIWMPASLRKKLQLARRVGLQGTDGLVEPCFITMGSQTRVYFAHVLSEECDTPECAISFYRIAR